ncbi:MAG: hypothetical protein H0T88_11345 [Lysobacter sp.]|nr:hypothetical protein [Lysobacter sp.]
MYYDTASVVIATEVDGRGDQRKLQTKLDNAWRAFWQELQLVVANGNLDALDQLLSSNATMGVSEESRSLIAAVASDFRQCINGKVPIATATVAVRVFLYDETTEDGKGGAAGKGVYLFVDGQHLGSTDSSGQAILTVPAGTVGVQAVIPSTAIAETTVEVAKGGTATLELILDDSKEVISPVQLSLSSMTGEVLPSILDSFTITLLDNDAPRAAVAVAEVAIEDDLGYTLQRLTDSFRVDALGRLEPIDLAVVASAVTRFPNKALVLRAMAEDAAGFTLLGTKPLYPGQHTLNVTLVAPPSNPTLAVAGIEVTYQLMGTGLKMVRTSDAAGNVFFGEVPRGNTSLYSTTMQSDRYYYGQASFFLSRARQARVTMTHARDITDGVPRFELLPLTNALSDNAVHIGDTAVAAAAHRDTLHAQLDAGGDLSPLSTESLLVGAGAADRQISGSRTMTVAQGTQRVILKYIVTTQEFPSFVTQQSVFNDIWSLSVHASQSGLQLFNIARNVNSQLRNAPVWLPSGSTGFIGRAST